MPGKRRNGLFVEELTAADIFVASEAYQDYRKAMRKDAKKIKNIISKLSDDDKKEHQRLMTLLGSAETTSEYEETVTALSELLGLDYQERVENLSLMTLELFRDQNFSTLELLQAQQRYNAQQSKMPKTKSYKEQSDIDNCRYHCDNAYSSILNYCIQTYPWVNPWEHEGTSPENMENRKRWQECVSGASDKHYQCINECY